MTPPSGGIASRRAQGRCRMGRWNQRRPPHHDRHVRRRRAGTSQFFGRPRERQMHHGIPELEGHDRRGHGERLRNGRHLHLRLDDSERATGSEGATPGRALAGRSLAGLGQSAFRSWLFARRRCAGLPRARPLRTATSLSAQWPAGAAPISLCAAVAPATRRPPAASSDSVMGASSIHGARDPRRPRGCLLPDGTAKCSVADSLIG